MLATLIYGRGDVRVEHVPDPCLHEPDDAIVRVIRSAICGSDLWHFRGRAPSETGGRIGHEFLGVVEDVGRDVSRLRLGDLVLAPFFYGDGICEHCRAGLTSACPRGNGWGYETDGAQGEAVRVPFADQVLLRLPPVPDDQTLLPGLLTLSDVFSTGHHVAVCAGVSPGRDVVVVGDGAVGLSGVLASCRLGARRIVIMGRHADRVAVARELGATDVVAARGAEGEQQVRDLLGPGGAHATLECVGLPEAMSTAIELTRPGGRVGVAGVPQSNTIPGARAQFAKNVTISGGMAPTQRIMRELLADVLDGAVDPGRVFDRDLELRDVPRGYEAMNERTALKVLVRP